MNRLEATIIIYGQIECVTGLHIGGSGGGYEIGGIDNPVIKNPRDGFPYIPGSSLKGKMRSLLEWAEGRVTEDGSPFVKGEIDDPILLLFGAPAETDRLAGPSRLIVRDAVPDSKAKEIMNELELSQGLPKVEVKTEVSINRITSKPPFGPRYIERVPVGICFDFEILYTIYKLDNLKIDDLEMIKKLFCAMRLLEDSALGGSGSRGSGQVRFLLAKPLVRKREDYYKESLPAKNEVDLNALKPLDEYAETALSEIKASLQ